MFIHLYFFVFIYHVLTGQRRSSYPVMRACAQSSFKVYVTFRMSSSVRTRAIIQTMFRGQ